jgi:hypothetical protein
MNDDEGEKRKENKTRPVNIYIYMYVQKVT